MELGEIDVKGTKAKLKAEEDKRNKPAGWTQSGGGGGGGFGYVGHDGLGGEAAAAEAARKDEARVRSEEKQRQRKAISALEEGSAEQHQLLLAARAQAAGGPSLNEHQHARITFRQKEAMVTAQRELSELEVGIHSVCRHSVKAVRADTVSRPTSLAPLLRRLPRLS